MSHWIYQGKVLRELPDDVVGFVYLIIEKSTGMKYLGRKYATKKITRPPLKGKKRKRVSWVESDWREYTGSNRVLNEKIELQGKDDYEFIILALAKTKGQVNYLEENLQHKLDVVLRKDFYNDSIGSRRFVNMKSGLEPIYSDIYLKITGML